MERNQMKPIEMVLKGVEYYTPYAVNIFNYLNGNINPYNPCVLTIKMYNAVNYAEFRKPNSVTLFLGSIVNNYYDSDENIKFISLITLAHELSHSWQYTDMVRYSKDPYYKEYIEDTNEAYTERWLLDHENEIYSTFGVKVEYSNYAIKNVLPKHTMYQSATAKDYYIHTIIDMIYRDNAYLEPLTTLFESLVNIVFSIDDSEIVLIKLNGKYLYDSIPKFGELLHRYCRAGLGLRYFSVSMTKTPVKLDESESADPATWIRILMNNSRYCPIVGIETVPKIEIMNELK